MAVSRTAMQIMYTIDTAIDASGWDAAMRAAPYLASEYFATLRANPPQRGSGAEWLTWKQHRAYTTAELTTADESGKPEDTPLRAFHAWYVTITATGRDGWTAQSPGQVVYVILERAETTSDWKVTEIHIR